jgi:predicted unusual protein kinase regulating ubiquinone biosynthesis (AarF/ABC1/UbiB family)
MSELPADPSSLSVGPQTTGVTGAPRRAPTRPRPERGVLGHAFLLAWMQTRIVLSYLWLFVRSRVLRSPPSPASLSATHRLNARRFKETACRLKGANVKVGQIASMQPHLLPAEFIEELRSLRDAVTPTDAKHVMALIEHELGRPVSELFASFDEVPMATASMGQVHGARLADGRRVVVKVLHPGLERTVEIDLALTRNLLGFFRRFVRTRIDLMVILREAEEPLRRELDLMHEGKATETLGRELEPLGIIVPAVHWGFTSRRVLTLDFIDGVNIDNRARMDAWKIDREKLMALYLQSFVQQALRGGYFHADPHPGNVFCTPDGRLALLDFGMVQRLPDNVRVGLLKETLGGFFARPALWADGMILKGAVGEADRGKLEAFAAEAFKDPEARAMIFDHSVGSHSELAGIVGRFAAFFNSLETLETPRDNVMFMRALGIIIDVMKEVVPEKSPSEIAAPVMMPVLMEFVQQHPEYLALLSDMPAMLAPQPAPAPAQ